MKYKCETCGDMLEGDERGPFTSNVAFTNGYWYHLPCARTHDDSGIQIKLPSGGKLIPETTTTSEQIIVEGVFAELRRSQKKHPGFPEDPIHAAAVIAEELGELQQAILHWTYEDGGVDDVLEEGIQTAAMALRFLFNLENMEPKRSLQIRKEG